MCFFSGSHSVNSGGGGGGGGEGPNNYVIRECL